MTTRQDACERLGLRRDRTAVQPLIALLDDPVTQWCAARSLGLLRDAQAVPALKGHLRLQGGGINRMAVWALGELGDVSAADDLQQLRAQYHAEFAADLAALDSAIAKTQARASKSGI